jgi:hypothetical protein
MGKFTYSGPMSAATLDDGTDVILFPGREVTLPAGNAWVKSLVAQKLLTPVPAEKPATTGGGAARVTETTKTETEAPAPVAGKKEGK